MSAFTKSLPLALAAVIAGACSDATGPAQLDAVQLSFSSGADAAASFLTTGTVVTGSAGLEVRMGGDSLVITSAEVVVEEVEFESDDLCDDHGGSSSDVSDDQSGNGEVGCGENEVELGPLVVDLPVRGGLTTTATLRVPPGAYTKLKYKIDKLDDDSRDETDAAERRPGLRRNSIRVEGTFNGRPFVYLSDIEAEVELAFSPPLVVEEGGFNVTVRVDVPSWFTTASGRIIDPATANAGGANEAAVDANVLASFGAFADRDRDGRRDGHSD